MELRFHGANCLTITTKHARITIDDNLSELGAESVTKVDDIVVFTHEHSTPPKTPKLLIDGPGEYEVSGVSIQGMVARAHIDEPSQKSNTIYKILAEDLRIVIAGHIYPELSDSQLEIIGTVDILCIPVGGNGYTLDGVGALNLIKKIEPKIVIPTHYADKDLHYPVPQQTLDEALKNLAMEPKEYIDKLKAKQFELTDTTQLIVLEKTQ